MNPVLHCAVTLLEVARRHVWPPDRTLGIDFEPVELTLGIKCSPLIHGTINGYVLSHTAPRLDHNLEDPSHGSSSGVLILLQDRSPRFNDAAHP